MKKKFRNQNSPRKFNRIKSSFKYYRTITFTEKAISKIHELSVLLYLNEYKSKGRYSNFLSKIKNEFINADLDTLNLKLKEYYIDYRITEPIGDWYNFNSTQNTISRYPNDKLIVTELIKVLIFRTQFNKSLIEDTLNEIVSAKSCNLMRYKVLENYLFNNRKSRYLYYSNLYYSQIDYFNPYMNNKYFCTINESDLDWKLKFNTCENLYLLFYEFGFIDDSTPLTTFLQLFFDLKYFDNHIYWKGDTKELCYFLFKCNKIKLFKNEKFIYYLTQFKPIFISKNGKPITYDNFMVNLNNFNFSNLELSNFSVLPKQTALIDWIIEQLI